MRDSNSCSSADRPGLGPPASAQHVPAPAVLGIESGPAKLRLLDQVRAEIRKRHYSPRTEKAYVAWIRRFIFFHRRRHPAEMGLPEIATFLSDLAAPKNVSASTQNQAWSALLFLYREILGRKMEGLEGVVRAKRPVRLPLVLSREEVGAILRQMRGTTALMASLLYGAGLRLLDCARLRVKDVDFGRNEITVRDGKGRKDRITMLPAKLAVPLTVHLDRIRREHARDLRRGGGRVALPDALNASTRLPGSNGPGSGSSPLAGPTSIARVASSCATTCTSRCCNGPSRRPSGPLAYPSRRVATRCATPSRPIFWIPAMTFARSRSFSATATSAPR